MAILIVLSCTRMLLTESLAPPWTIMGFVAASASQPDSETAAAEAAMWGGPTPASSMGMFAWVLLAGLLWAIAQAISPRRIVGGFALLMIAMFAAGAIVSTGLASNKAAARNNAIQFLGYLVSFWLLLQLLATVRWRQVAVVAVVTAGACFAGYGIYQHVVDNPDFIANKWPAERDRYYAEHRLQPDDPQARMMEERVRSAEVKSFALNANSAAALLIVATLAAAGWAVRKWRTPSAPLRRFFATAAIAAAGVILFMLLLTRSRGGISGGLLALGLFAGLGITRRWACAHWKALAIAAVAIVVAVSATVIAACAVMKQPEPDSFWYRNNGAMSMLYRWQYWVGTAGVIADHPWGVGGGNFGTAYQAHKLPAALEDVDDPHNVVLAALAQYGPLGAAGLLGLIGWVFWKLVKRKSERGYLPPPPGEGKGEGISSSAKRQAVLPAIVALGFGLLLAAVRTWIQWPNYADLPVNLLIAVFGPVIVLVLLLDRDELDWPGPGGEEWVRAAIGCGLAGFLLACTIDFGMSQAGPATAFWTLAAIAVAGKVWAGREATCYQAALNDKQRTTAQNDKSDAALVGGKWTCAIFGALLIVHVLMVYKPAADGESSMKELSARPFGYVDDEDMMPFKHYANADRLDPAIPEGMAQWATRFEGRDEAERLWKLACRRDPKNAHYLVTAAEFARDKVDAAHLVSEATRLAPHSLSIWQQAGEVFRRVGDTSRAADYFARAIQIDDTIRRYDVKKLFSLSARARGELAAMYQESQAGLHSTTQPSP